MNIALADDRPATLTKYAFLPVNVEGVVATIKAYVLPVAAYDMLLGMKYQRRVGMNVDLEGGKLTIRGDDQKYRSVPAKLAPITIRTHLPTVEIVEEEIDDTEEMLQAIIDGNESDDAEKRGRW
jgi:hypothetical protein